MFVRRVAERCDAAERAAVKVLLTGAAGFIGTAIWTELATRGHEVIAVDAFIPQAHATHAQASAPPDVRHLDVRHAGDWVDLLRGVDVVCHQAAMVGAGANVADLPDYAGHNDLGTAALLAAMHEAGVRGVRFNYVKRLVDPKPDAYYRRIIDKIAEFGWHIVQVLNRAPDLAAMKTKIDGGADFATLARDFSEGPEASVGGDLGWIAHGQLDETLGAPIFAAPIGKTSDVVTVAEDGQYLFLVTKEEERTPEGAQLDQIRSRAFAAWYDPKKAAIVVTRDPAIVSPVSS